MYDIYHKEVVADFRVEALGRAICCENFGVYKPKWMLDIEGATPIVRRRPR